MLEVEAAYKTSLDDVLRNLPSFVDHHMCVLLCTLLVSLEPRDFATQVSFGRACCVHFYPVLAISSGCFVICHCLPVTSQPQNTQAGACCLCLAFAP